MDLRVADPLQTTLENHIIIISSNRFLGHQIEMPLRISILIISELAEVELGTAIGKL
jgi:hypothetical protein